MRSWVPLVPSVKICCLEKKHAEPKITEDPRIDPRIKALFGEMALPPQENVEIESRYWRQQTLKRDRLHAKV